MRNRKIHILIVAAAFGILAWFSVTLREEYTVTINAPFLLENVPDGLAVRSPIPQTMQLRFHGDGWHLAGLLLRGNPQLIFSATALPPGSRPISFNDVAERVTITPGIQLLDVRPESVHVEFDRLTRKRVPVILDCAASFREGYGQVGATSVTPDSIVLTGAESVLRPIDAWKTERRVFEDLKTPLDITVPLAPAERYVIALSAPAVRLGIMVEPFAEKVFNGVPVDVIEVPDNREVILIPPKIELVVRAGIKQLSALSPGDFHVSLRYALIAADTTGSVDADIAAPSGVQVVTKRPERLQYIVRKRL